MRVKINADIVFEIGEISDAEQAKGRHDRGVVMGEYQNEFALKHENWLLLKLTDSLGLLCEIYLIWPSLKGIQGNLIYRYRDIADLTDAKFEVKRFGSM